MILISKLYNRASELSQIGVNQISEFVTFQNCLLLKYAHISPRLDNTSVYIPQCGIAQKICIIMKETGRSDYFSIGISLNINHLC